MSWSAVRLSPTCIQVRPPAPLRVSTALRDPTRWSVVPIGGGDPLPVLSVGIAPGASQVPILSIFTAWPGFGAGFTITVDPAGLQRAADGGEPMAPPDPIAVDEAGGSAGGLRLYRWLEIQGIPEGFPLPVPYSPDGGADPGRASRAQPRVTIPGEYFAAGGAVSIGSKLDLERGRASIDTLNLKLVDLDGRLVQLFQSEDESDAPEMRVGSIGGAERIEASAASVAAFPLTVVNGGASDAYPDETYVFAGKQTLLLADRAQVGSTATWEYDIATGQAGSEREILYSGTPVTRFPAMWQGREARLWEVDLALSTTPKCIFAGVMDEPQAESLVAWVIRIRDMSAKWDEKKFSERLALLPVARRSGPWDEGGETITMDTTAPRLENELSRGFAVLDGPRTALGITADSSASNTAVGAHDNPRGWDDLPQGDVPTARGYTAFHDDPDSRAVVWIRTPWGLRVMRIKSSDNALSRYWDIEHNDVRPPSGDVDLALRSDWPGQVEAQYSQSGGVRRFLGASIGGARVGLQPGARYDVVSVDFPAGYKRSFAGGISYPVPVIPLPEQSRAVWASGRIADGLTTDTGALDEVLPIAWRPDEDSGLWPDPDVNSGSFAACIARLLVSTGTGDNGIWDVMPAKYGLGIPADDVDWSGFESEMRRSNILGYGFADRDTSGGLWTLLAERVALPAGCFLIHTRAGGVRLRRVRDLLAHEQAAWSFGPDTVLYDPPPRLTVDPRFAAHSAVKFELEDRFVDRLCADPGVQVVNPAVTRRNPSAGALTLKPLLTYGADAPAAASTAARIASGLLGLFSRGITRYEVTLPAVGADGTDYRDVEIGQVVEVEKIPVATRLGTRILGESAPVRLLCVETKYDLTAGKVTLVLADAINRRGRRLGGFSWSGRVVALSVSGLMVDVARVPPEHTQESVASPIPTGLALGDVVRPLWIGPQTTPGESIAAIIDCQPLSGPDRWRVELTALETAWLAPIYGLATTYAPSDTLVLSGDWRGYFAPGDALFHTGSGNNPNDGDEVLEVSFDGGTTRTSLVLAPTFDPTGLLSGSQYAWARLYLWQAEYDDGTPNSRLFAHWADGEWIDDADGIPYSPPVRPTVGAAEEPAYPWTDD